MKKLIALGLLIALAGISNAHAAEPSPPATPQVIHTKVNLIYSKPSEVLASLGIKPLDHEPLPYRAPSGVLQVVAFDLDSSILVKGTQTAIDEFKAIVQKFDAPPSQVYLNLGVLELPTANSSYFTDLTSAKQFKRLECPYGLLVIDKKTLPDKKWNLVRPPDERYVSNAISKFRRRSTEPPAYDITSRIDAKGLAVITVQIPDVPSIATPDKDGALVPREWRLLCETTITPGDAMILTYADNTTGKAFIVTMGPTVHSGLEGVEP